MPHNAVKLIPGVDTTRTVALNEAALSSTNLIRLVPDRQGIGLVQKLGGWTNYYPYAFTSPIRALKGWADLNQVNHLAVGTETSLTVLTDGNPANITPLESITSVAPKFSISSGSRTATVTDASIIASVLDCVSYATPVSVGGVVFSGLYQIQTAAGNVYAVNNSSAATLTENTDTAISAGSFVVGKGYVIASLGTTTQSQWNTIAGTTGETYIVGNVFYAATTGAASGTGTAKPLAIPAFKATANDPEIEVIMNYANYAVGDIFTISNDVPVTVGGVQLVGNYSVSQVTSANKFKIYSHALPSSTTTNYVIMNNNQVFSTFYVAVGPQPDFTGYGVGGYGVGGYGTGSSQIPSTSTPITATDWTLDNFGQILISCPTGGAIYYYDPTGAATTDSVLGEQCPLFNDGIFVAMPQRQVVAYGSSFGFNNDPLLVRWSDIEDFQTWVATSTNQAGSYRIPSGSKIVSAMQAYQQGLLWTDLDVWSMQYVGPPYVYGFNKVGSNCGAISRKCTGTLNNVVYWMSQKQFFRMSGNGVENLPCPVWDVVFQNLNLNQTDKIRCAVNTQFNEVVWYYPSSTSTENDSYVKYNVPLNQWDFGTLGRSAWIDQSVLGPPIGAGTDGYLYQHETTNAATSGTQAGPMLSSITTGYFALSEADKLIFIDQIWPDMKWGSYSGAKDATVNITFFCTNYAGDTPVQYGPYPMTRDTQYISVRIRARLMSINIASPTTSDSTGQFWRLGNIRYRFQEDGRF